MKTIFDKPSHTIGEFVGAVVAIDNERDARAFAEIYAEWLARTKPPIGAGDEWQFVMRTNIGWCFGEGMTQEQIDMWVRVCGTSHPVFGTKKMTPDQLFAAGMEWAKRNMM